VPIGSWAQDAPEDRFPGILTEPAAAAPPPEGTLTFGLWYSQAEEVSATVEIEQDRIAGRDENLRFGASLSQYSQSAFVTLTDPDFFEGPYTRQLAFSIRSAGPNATQRGDYSFTTADASIGFGRVWSDTLGFSFGAGVTQYWLDSDDALPQFIADYVAEVGESPTDFFLYGNAIWDFTTRAGWQRQGARLRLRSQLGSAGGTGYVRALAGAEQFLPLGAVGEMRAHGALGVGEDLGGGPYPIFRHFTGGGPGSVRGFTEGTLGPTSPIPGEDDPAYAGGQFSVLAGIEARTPLGGRDDLFALGFFDIGNIFADAAAYDGNRLRSSVGVGVQWESPIGPLSVFFAEPLASEEGDEISRVQFLFGLRL
jgi:outer membrane protein insertion porin family